MSATPLHWDLLAWVRERCAASGVDFRAEMEAVADAAGEMFEAVRKMPGGDDLTVLLELSRYHVMTEQECAAQRESWVRGEMALAADEREMTRRVPSIADLDAVARERQAAELTADG